MTDDKDFKKLVRDRAAKTGESYRAARAQLRPASAQGEGQNFTLSGETAIRIFSLAEQEARVGGDPAVWPEHVLLALLDDGGMALRLLQRLKVSPVAVRHAIRQRINTAARTVPSRHVPGAWEKPGAAPAYRPALSAEIRSLLGGTVGQSRPATDASVELLLALVRSSSTCADVLASYGATLERLTAPSDAQPPAPR